MACRRQAENVIEGRSLARTRSPLRRLQPDRLRERVLADGFEDGERRRLKPVNVTVDFMRGGRDHETRAVGLVTRIGARIANVEAVAWQEDRNKPIARARMTVLVAR